MSNGSCSAMGREEGDYIVYCPDSKGRGNTHTVHSPSVIKAMTSTTEFPSLHTRHSLTQLKLVVGHSSTTFLSRPVGGHGFSFMTKLTRIISPSKLMDQWSADLSIPSSQSGDQRSIRGTRPLQAVSGNRQSYALDNQAGPENQSPHDPLEVTAAFPNNTKYPPTSFPASATLGSNDYQRNIRRLNHHRHHRRHRHRGPSAESRYHDRTYLQTEKYLEYRARHRKDLGSDNKQVWSDDVEEAFQEGRYHLLSGSIDISLLLTLRSHL
jgi:hypothetical protein